MRGKDAISSQSIPAASYRSRSSRLWQVAGLKFNLCQILIHKTRQVLQLSRSRSNPLKYSSSSSTNLTTTSFQTSLNSSEIATRRTKCPCLEWISRCPSIGQSCRWDLRMTRMLCPSDLTKQAFNISRIKRQTPQMLNLRQMAWVVCVWPTPPISLNSEFRLYIESH